ncbi:MAG: hypothetical protein ACT4PT_07175 [Methanobacteriota archaeon]
MRATLVVLSVLALAFGMSALPEVLPGPIGSADAAPPLWCGHGRPEPYCVSRCYWIGPVIFCL